MTNEQLMWSALGIWLIFVVIMLYQLIFGKSTPQQLPSGNTADTSANWSVS